MLVWVGASVGEEGHVYALRIVSRDKILHFKNTLIIIITFYVARDRPVTSYYEKLRSEQVEQVLPIMSQPFDFKQKRYVTLHSVVKLFCFCF